MKQTDSLRKHIKGCLAISYAKMFSPDNRKEKKKFAEFIAENFYLTGSVIHLIDSDRIWGGKQTVVFDFVTKRGPIDFQDLNQWKFSKNVEFIHEYKTTLFLNILNEQKIEIDPTISFRIFFAFSKSMREALETVEKSSMFLHNTIVYDLKTEEFMCRRAAWDALKANELRFNRRYFQHEHAKPIDVILCDQVSIAINVNKNLGLYITPNSEVDRFLKNYEDLGLDTAISVLQKIKDRTIHE